MGRTIWFDSPYGTGPQRNSIAYQGNSPFPWRRNISRFTLLLTPVTITILFVCSTRWWEVTTGSGVWLPSINHIYIACDPANFPSTTVTSPMVSPRLFVSPSNVHFVENNVIWDWHLKVAHKKTKPIVWIVCFIDIILFSFLFREQLLKCYKAVCCWLYYSTFSFLLRLLFW